MIRNLEGTFILDTRTTTYCFRVLESGHLEHLYYGGRVELHSAEQAEVFTEKHAFAPGNSNCYSADFSNYSLEDMRLEMSSYGKSDIREPFIELTHADGSYTNDFIFKEAVIEKGKAPFETLPGSYEENGEVETLKVVLYDANYDTTLELYYYVFEKYDVITRAAKFVNTSKETVVLKRLLSGQLDFETDDYIMTTFHGAWGREMERYDVPIRIGKFVNASYCGCSSSRSNPFVMLSKEETSEQAGPCYGMNLVYSGNHYEAAEVNAHHKTRVVTGINPQSFSFTLQPGETFEAPEAVFTYSSEGFGGMSRNMTHFVSECIIRGEWKKKPRPVLLNSWEAAYFDIDENKLLKLAKAGKNVGVELFVMDDGWFGERIDDKRSLGDWTVNREKLPNGVQGICKKVNDLGLDFGIWVEPEMVNVDSDLYRAHPDWTLSIPGKPHSEGRNQRILDLTNPEVVDYMIEAMCDIFSSANIAYVKWDMNRIFSDYYSPNLPSSAQEEVAHRYMLGLYRMLSTIMGRFPKILFEGCASGGNRFDLGMLCYFPQIWASDDTDALYRVTGQTGYSYGYPMSAVTAHVSACPNHQTLRTTPLTTRFNVAIFGNFGYECNLCEMKKDELEEIKAQIAIYKAWRDVLQYGTFYRGRQGNIYEWTCVSPDKTKAVGLLFQQLVRPNTAFEQYTPSGLDKDKIYKFSNRDLRYNVKDFGDLINTVSPIHIKKDSFLHNLVAKFVTLPGETECYVASGAALMGGVKIKQGFGSTGYNDETRFFQDFGSRIYFMEEVIVDDKTEE